MKKPIKKSPTRKKQQKTVYTYGVFDLFHRGHIELLRDAKALGDKLMVGLFTDEVVKKFKREPIIPLDHRIPMLEHCVFVDKVVIQDELQPDKNIRTHKPHILAKGPGAGWGEGSTEIPGAKTMNEIGGKVVVLEYHEGISTSQIINKIRSTKH